MPRIIGPQIPVGPILFNAGAIDYRVPVHRSIVAMPRLKVFV
jgi:hypothetical protein